MKKHKIQRSIDEHSKYYRAKSMKEKLKETIEISELCMKLSGSKAVFHGKK